MSNRFALDHHSASIILFKFIVLNLSKFLVDSYHLDNRTTIPGTDRTRIQTVHLERDQSHPNSPKETAFLVTYGLPIPPVFEAGQKQKSLRDQTLIRSISHVPVKGNIQDFLSFTGFKYTIATCFRLS